MYDEPEPLFMRGDLGATLDDIRQKAIQKVAEIPAQQLLSLSENDLVSTLVEDHRMESVAMTREDIYVDEPREVALDMTGNFRYDTFPGERSIVPGTSVTVHVPFTGTSLQLMARPSTFTLNTPHARIKANELLFDFQAPTLDGATVRKEVEGLLTNIEGNLRNGVPQIDRHNERLAKEVQEAFAKRKQRLLDSQGMVASIGFPLKRRELPQTYSIPMTPRRPKIVMPTPTSPAFKAEPALTNDDYEAILQIIQDMNLVMERSPHAFATMKEEDIRTHILVQLNGHFQGQATGETFNYNGKTDILIRVQNRNVFIAECKFWNGEKALLETIDQLLGYSSWRDTKTAIVLLNRRKDFSAVLAPLPGIMAKHPNFKKALGKTGDTQFRSLLHHRDDRNRELLLTVMAFDVPSPAES